MTALHCAKGVLGGYHFWTEGQSNYREFDNAMQVNHDFVVIIEWLSFRLFLQTRAMPQCTNEIKSSSSHPFPPFRNGVFSEQEMCNLLYALPQFRKPPNEVMQSLENIKAAFCPRRKIQMLAYITYAPNTGNQPCPCECRPEQELQQ